MMETTSDLRCTGSSVGQFNCWWTLQKFSNYDLTKSYKSGFFLPKRTSELKFFLELRLNGSSEKKSEYIGCFIFVKGPSVYEDNGISISFNMSLLNTNHEVLEDECVKWKNVKPSNGYGVPEFIERKKLLAKLIDDTLVINVEGLYSFSTITKNNFTEYFSDISSFAKMAIDYESFYDEMNNSDARVIVGEDGEVELLVHEAVLSARSKVFAAMFEHDTEEKESGVVKIRDFETDTIKSMLKFMYTGRIDDLNFTLALDLIRAADKYDLDDLKASCTNFLRLQMDEENFADILVNAHVLNAIDLQKSAIEYFLKHSSSIDLKKYRSVLSKHPDVFFDIVEAMK